MNLTDVKYDGLSKPLCYIGTHYAHNKIHPTQGKGQVNKSSGITGNKKIRLLRCEKWTNKLGLFLKAQISALFTGKWKRGR